MKTDKISQVQPFIVSEIGCNWDGDLSLAKVMIARSRKAGADVVKFQWFSREQLEGRGFDEETIQKILRSSMDKKTAKELKIYAEEIIGIEWFCTPFNIQATRELLDLEVKRLKVRFIDATRWYEDGAPLPDHIEEIFFKSKQTIISINGKPEEVMYGNIQWLYCVPKYPTLKEDIDWKVMKACKGFSCHCLDMSIWGKVKEQNLGMVEIHTTIERDGTHVDDLVSYNFQELKQICKILKK